MTPEDLATSFGPYRPEGYTARRAKLNMCEKLRSEDFRNDLLPHVGEWPADYDVDRAGVVANGSQGERTGRYRPEPEGHPGSAAQDQPGVEQGGDGPPEGCSGRPVGPAFELAVPPSRARRERPRARKTERSRLRVTRAKLEGKLADEQKKLHTAEGELAKEQARVQQRTMDQLRSSIDRSQTQFRPTSGSSWAPPSNSEPIADYDVSISHASGDKDEVATPLAEGLKARGLRRAGGWPRRMLQPLHW